MEESNKDPYDTETSSEGSWILLSNEEAQADFASVQANRNCLLKSLNEVVDKLTDVDNKNIHSDTESDGISIIAESDYSQVSESEDECNNIEVGSQYEEHEGKKDISSKGDKLWPEIDTKDHVEENIDNTDLKKDITPSVKAEQITENLSSQIMNDKEEVHFYIFLNHMKKLVTWPSVLCTSIVIFAVIIFPYFSDIDEATTLNQPDTKQFDEISLEDKNIGGVLDSLDFVYFTEITKEENDNPYVKRCMKRLLKHMKRFKNNDITVRYISSSKAVNKDDNLIEYTDSFLVEKKYKDKEEHSRHECEKYKKFFDFQIPSSILLKDYNIDLDGGNIDNSEQYSLGNDLIKNKDKYNTQLQGSQHIGDGKKKYFKTQFGRKTFDKLKEQLNELRESLLEKEQFLKKWQKQLTERELRLDKRIKEKHNNQKIGREKLGKFKKQKGDFDKDGYEQKFVRDRTQTSRFKLKDKQKKYEKHLKPPVESRDFHKPYKWSSKDEKKNKDVREMKGFFYKKTARNYEGKKEAEFLKKNINRESTKRVSVNLDSNYLILPTLVKKNRTKVMDDENFTVNGEWYLNLVHGRHDIRTKEGRASWWFDRAEFRKNRRNKAFWYFQYMINRENLRQKKI